MEAKILSERNCTYCKKTFQPRYSWNSYCSKDCVRLNRRKNYQAKNEPKECGVCKTIFITSQERKHYCSDACKETRLEERRSKLNAYQAARRAAREKKWKKPITCLNESCENSFIPRATAHRFCSVKCRESQFKLDKARISARMARINEKKNCLWCGSSFETFSARTTCSHACRMSLFRLKKNEKKEMKGEDEGGGPLIAASLGGLDRDQERALDTSEGTLSPWGRILTHCKIDFTPTELNPEDSDFSAEIANFLKKGGKIQKMPVGFCYHPIVI